MADYSKVGDMMDKNSIGFQLSRNFYVRMHEI